MMSFLPITCRVGVEYEGDMRVAARRSGGLNPDTETQNLLVEKRGSE
jgi:hypothetical protein